MIFLIKIGILSEKSKGLIKIFPALPTLLRICEVGDRLNTFQTQCTPTKVFLQDLQIIMSKKLQVTERCMSDQSENPNQALGFSEENIHHLLGTEQDYSKNETGVWVMQSQQDIKQRIAKANQEWQILYHEEN